MSSSLPVVDAAQAPVLRALALEKTYAPLAAGGAGLRLFQDLSLEVAAGEMVAVVGESGAGKSSLLHLLAALDTPTLGRGVVRRDQRDAVERAAGRRVSQSGDRLCVAVPLPAAGVYGAGECGDAAACRAEPGEARRWRRQARWLQRVGLGDRGEHRSGELSGGEQQRLSIARALITKPKLLLADEPTGDLDGATAERVFALLQELHRENALASVLVTHNLEFAGRCDRMLRLKDGRLEEQGLGL